MDTGIKFKGNLQNVHIKLSNQEKRSKKLLDDAISNSNNSYKKLRQGRTLYSVIDKESQSTGLQILPKIKFDANWNAKYENTGGQIAMFDNEFLTQKVDKFLDICQIKYQKI